MVDGSKPGYLTQLIGRQRAVFARHGFNGLVQAIEQHRSVRRFGVGYFNFWDIGPVADSWFYRFLQRPALRDLAKRRRVGFFSVYRPNRWLTRVPYCDRRVFYTAENLERFPLYHDHLFGRVDIALGFDEVHDDRYLRFPHWLVECFDPAATVADIERTLNEWENERRKVGQSERPSAAVIVARHDRNGIRGRIGDLVENSLPVTYAGAFRNNTDLVLGSSYSDKIALLRGFRYNICPENSDRPGYVTEKIFHAVQAGCVPIYWGSDNKPEPAILNQRAVLFFRPDQPALLTERLGALQASERAFTDFTSRPVFVPGAAARIVRYYTDLENRLISLLR